MIYEGTGEKRASRTNFQPSRATPLERILKYLFLRAQSIAEVEFLNINLRIQNEINSEQIRKEEKRRKCT
jgi:hypothetical protein